MIKFKKEKFYSKILFVLVLSLIIAPMQTYGVSHTQNLTTEDLFPAYNNYHWSYNGFVEYGHDMSVDSIIKNQTSTHYNISGSVYDASGGASNTDYSITLDYIIESDVVTQNKDEEAMLDSKYDSIELIRTPLEQGTTWTQSVTDANGNTTSLVSTITDVDTSDNNKVFTVSYQDASSPYYEERKIEEGVGVISFEKLMISEDSSYSVGYSLFEESSGVALDVDFSDVAGDDWYEKYVDKLVTMNLIDGYPDDTFRPDNEITVAEFIKITVESLSFYPGQGEDLWYTPYISKAIELDLIDSEEFDDYDRPIERDEMTKIIVNALDEEPEQGTLEFSDSTNIEVEYRPYIYTAVELGLIAGYPSDNSFRPDDISTRAEASKLFVLMVEDHIAIELFTKDDGLALETAFEDRLFQETEDDSWVVKDFDTIEAVIDHMAEITSRELAETYVGNYYEYMDGELTLPPKDGPTKILEDRDYQLKVVHPRAYRITQETTTEMVGNYTLKVTYHYENNDWIMEARDVEVHENN